MVALLVLRFKRLLKLSYMKNVGKGFIISTQTIYIFYHSGYHPMDIFGSDPLDLGQTP